jgi:hypothetical protein
MPTDLGLKTHSREPDTNPITTLGWAVFLGVSWTWCIGMYLPVLMVRDFGFWGWVVFAVPNVVGAAAMGWVLRDAKASERITANHPVACAAFSAVTIMFQIEFAGGVVRELMGDAAGSILLAGVLGTIVLTLASRRGDLVAAAVTLIVSLTAIHVAVRAAHDAHQSGFPWFAAHPSPERVRDLLMLTPVVVFGFLLCPYLDLTFHRARQSTGPRSGAVAFIVGFFGPFLAMIVFTLWYAPLLESHQRAMHLPQPLRWAIGLHMSVQCAFTVAVHVRELLLSGRDNLRNDSAAGYDPAPGERPAFETLDYSNLPDTGTKVDGRKLAGLVLGLAASVLPHVAASMAEKSAYDVEGHGECVYRLFMAFYGLVFPAYVWFCMVRLRDGEAAGPTRKKLRLMAAAVLIAAPMYWKGFIDNEMIWLLPGIGVVLLTRLLLLWKPRSKLGKL